MVAGFEIYFPRMLLSVLHERAFKAWTTYSFSCMIFELFRATGVLIWHMDVLRTSTRIVDIDLIMDEANEAKPYRGPRVGVQLLGENLEHLAASEPTDTTPVKSIQGTNGAPSSS